MLGMRLYRVARQIKLTISFCYK